MTPPASACDDDDTCRVLKSWYENMTQQSTDEPSLVSVRSKAYVTFVAKHWSRGFEALPPSHSQHRCVSMLFLDGRVWRIKGSHCVCRWESSHCHSDIWRMCLCGSVRRKRRMYLEIAIIYWNWPLLFADDVNIGRKHKYLKKNTEPQLQACRKVDLEISTEKTKYMVVSRHQNAVNNDC